MERGLPRSSEDTKRAEHQLASRFPLGVTPPTEKIERREAMSYREFYTDYQRRRRPVIIEGALRAWKAVGRWTPEFFRMKYGSKVVEIGGTSYRLAELLNLVDQSRLTPPALISITSFSEMNFRRKSWTSLPIQSSTAATGSSRR